jgi:large subunit ribosomal protein L35
MPKMKTHSGTRKRVRLTGSGKLIHEQTNRKHKFEKKPTTRTRRLAMDAAIAPADRRRIKKLLGK